MMLTLLDSALEGAVRKHSSGSSGSAALTGKGHTLGGSSTAAPTGGMGIPRPDFQGVFNKLDPQARVLLCLLGAYALFWLIS